MFVISKTELDTLGYLCVSDNNQEQFMHINNIIKTLGLDIPNKQIHKEQLINYLEMFGKVYPGDCNYLTTPNRNYLTFF